MKKEIILALSFTIVFCTNLFSQETAPRIVLDSLSSKEYFGKELWEMEVIPDYWIERCPVCKELYKDEGAMGLTEEEEIMKEIHWVHEEEAFITKYFNADALQKYRKENIRPWKEDEMFFDFLENDIEWSRTRTNPVTGVAERELLKGGYNTETEWLSISEIESVWVKYLQWKNQNNRNTLPAGRSGGGALVKPNYNGNAEGRVVVEIKADQFGTVHEATVLPEESTTTDENLIQAAIDAAKKSRLGNIDTKGEQYYIGKLTYNFRK